jgi:hypothetical protein
MAPNLGHLISHTVHREISKKLGDLCGLCERRAKGELLSKLVMAEIRTNSNKAKSVLLL